jgi:hypothetical protein
MALTLITGPACRMSSATRPAAARPTTADVLFSLSGSQQDFEHGIRALQAADATADAAEAQHGNDHRLIGMMGYALVVPGMDPLSADDPPPGYTVVPIKAQVTPS